MALSFISLATHSYCYAMLCCAAHSKTPAESKPGRRELGPSCIFDVLLQTVKEQQDQRS